MNMNQHYCSSFMLGSMHLEIEAHATQTTRIDDLEDTDGTSYDPLANHFARHIMRNMRAPVLLQETQANHLEFSDYEVSTAL